MNVKFSLLSALTLSFCAQQTIASNAFDVNSPWMLGDWNGQRTALQEKGYTFSMGYTGEMATLLHSKDTSSHGTEFSGQLALASQFDLEKILGWKDTEAKITITYRDGQNLSNTSPALAGQQSSVQEVWGRGQTWRLTDLWIKKKFFDQALDIKVGRFGESEDFNSFSCDFQNLALCGSQIGKGAGTQWYDWPVSQWAARVKYNVTPEFYAQIGVFEYNPENLKRGKGFNLSTRGSKGALIPVEGVWSPKLGVEQLPGNYHVGFFYSTADAEKFNDLGNATDETAHKRAGWITAKQQVTTHNGDVNRGLTVWANLAFFDHETSRRHSTQNIAFIYKGAFDARPKDEIAVGFARYEQSGQNKAGQDLGSEYNSEIYYGVSATNWLTVRPNIQYVHNVGAVRDGNNAWVGGIKFVTEF